MDKPIDLTVPILVSGDLVGQDSGKTSLAGPRERPVRNLESPLVGLEGFDPGRYMTCIGLALKDVLLTETGAVANSVVNFNVLPEIYQVRKRPLAEVLWVPTVLVGVVLIGMGTWGIIFLKSENSDLVSQRDNINRTMQEQLVRKADLDALTTQVGAAEAPAASLKGLLDSLDAGRISITTDLSLIQDYATESGVSLDSVGTGTKGIDISGSADTEDEVFKYGWLLENSGRFSTVMIPSISASDTGVQFSMVLSK
jgi:type IV pilus assembly protein PilM